MPSLHMLQRARRRLPLQFVHIHVPTMPLRNPPIRGRISSVVWAGEQRHKALREQDYGADTLSIAAKMAANRASTSARMPGCVKT